MVLSISTPNSLHRKHGTHSGNFRFGMMWRSVSVSSPQTLPHVRGALTCIRLGTLTLPGPRLCRPTFRHIVLPHNLKGGTQSPPTPRGDPVCIIHLGKTIGPAGRVCPRTLHGQTRGYNTMITRMAGASGIKQTKLTIERPLTQSLGTRMSLAMLLTVLQRDLRASLQATKRMLAASSLQTALYLPHTLTRIWYTDARSVTSLSSNGHNVNITFTQSASLGSFSPQDLKTKRFCKVCVVLMLSAQFHHSSVV